MTYLKPLFNIERIHIDGSRLVYKLNYKYDNQFKPVIDALFLDWASVIDFRDDLLDGLNTRLDNKYINKNKRG